MLTLVCLMCTTKLTTIAPACYGESTCAGTIISGITTQETCCMSGSGGISFDPDSGVPGGCVECPIIGMLARLH